MAYNLTPDQLGQFQNISTGTDLSDIRGLEDMWGQSLGSQANFVGGLGNPYATADMSAYRGGERFTGVNEAGADALRAQGLDPNAQYMTGSFRAPGGGKYDYNRLLYQQQGDNWVPVSGIGYQRNPSAQTWGDFGLATIAALGSIYGAGAAYAGAGAGAGAGAAGGSGISASGTGAATGSGLGATASGTGYGLAAPTAGATGSGLSTAGFSGYGAGLGAGAGAGTGSALGSMYESPSYALDGGGASFGEAGSTGYGGGGTGLGGTGYGGIGEGLGTSVSDAALGYETASALSGVGDFAPAAYDIGSGSLSAGAGSSNPLIQGVRDLYAQYKKAKPFIQGARQISGQIQAHQARKSAKQYANQLGQTAQGLQDLYSPNSAYAQQLRQQLARKDAAAGRRSQYGTREVELQARLAELNSRNAPALADIYGRQQQARAGADAARNQQLFNALSFAGQNPELINKGVDYLGGLFG